jgi:hypothetical protein
MLITGPEQAGSVSRDCRSRLAGEARMSEATAGVRLQAGSYAHGSAAATSLEAMYT